MSVTTTAPRQTVVPARRPEAGPSLPVVPGTVGAQLLVPTTRGPQQYANLDHGASTPALIRVKTAVDRALLSYASVHRGNGYASRVTSRWYEEARAEVAAFVGARDDDLVIFTRTTTDAWSVLARALPEDTTVFVTAGEHHSTLLPWGEHRTVTLPVPVSLAEALGRLEAALAADASSNRLVVITAASNVTGELWPLDKLVRIAARYGARLAVDAAQLAPHRPIDLAGSGVDYVAFSGHKVYAPFGAGVLAGRADWLDAGQPYLPGGGAATRVHTDENSDQVRTTWATGAARQEGGSPNVIGAIALAAACAELRENWAAIIEHEELLATRLREGLAAIPGVRLYTLFGDAPQVGVVAFTVDGVPGSEVSTALSYAHGIGVRDGKFCAHLLVDHLLAGTGHQTAVRASIGLASTAEHIERLIAGVREIALAAADGTWTAPQDPGHELDAARPW